MRIRVKASFRIRDADEWRRRATFLPEAPSPRKLTRIACMERVNGSPQRHEAARMIHGLVQPPKGLLLLPVVNWCLVSLGDGSQVTQVDG
jgi:hypothetical protein